MKVSKEQAAKNRERILDTASRLFRERGFDGIGVADLMKSAGLTHGGFYGHFASKEDLMAQAAARALANSEELWRRRAEKASETFSPLSEGIAAYLSPAHRDKPGEGCLLAALGGDVSRQGGPVRRAVTDGVHSFIERLSGLVPGRSAEERRKRALSIYAGLIGGLVLARAVDDPEFSEEILKAVAESLDIPASDRVN